MVYHVLNGLKELSDKDIDLLLAAPEYRKNFTICNYRFVKEFTAGDKNHWIINYINQNKVIDIDNERTDEPDE